VGPDQSATATDPEPDGKVGVGLAFAQVSQHQVGRLAAGFDALDADPQKIRREKCGQ